MSGRVMRDRRWPEDLTEAYELVARSTDAGEEYERTLRRVYEAVLEPGDVAFDIGAHVGKHAVPMALAVGPTGRVVAVEPIDWAADRLVGRRDRAGLTDVLAVQFGCCGEREGTVTFSVVPDRPGLSSKHTRHNVTNTIEVDVRQYTVDHLTAEHGSPRFVKIDVEGAEVDVLRGATATLSAARPVLHLEVVVNALAAFGVGLEQLYELVSGAGYRIFDLLGHDVSDLDSWLLSGSLTAPADYIAVHPEDRALDSVTRVLQTSFQHVRETSTNRLLTLALGRIDRQLSVSLGSPIVDGGRRVLDQFLHHPELPVSGGWPVSLTANEPPVVRSGRNGAAIVDAEKGTITPLHPPVHVSLPMHGTVDALTHGDEIRLTLDVGTMPSRWPVAICELHWPEAGLTGLVRSHYGTMSEVDWFLHGRRVGRDQAPSAPTAALDVRVRVTDRSLRLGVLPDLGRLAERAVSIDTRDIGPAEISIGGRRHGKPAGTMENQPAQLSLVVARAGGASPDRRRDRRLQVERARQRSRTTVARLARALTRRRRTYAARVRAARRWLPRR